MTTMKCGERGTADAVAGLARDMLVELEAACTLVDQDGSMYTAPGFEGSVEGFRERMAALGIEPGTGSGQGLEKMEKINLGGRLEMERTQFGEGV